MSITNVQTVQCFLTTLSGWWPPRSLPGEFEVGDTAVVDAEGGEMRITVTGDLCDPTEHQCYTSEEDVQLIEQMKVGQVDSITA